nr:uncharacterized protein [Tanacetum cinerariifolium]
MHMTPIPEVGIVLSVHNEGKELLWSIASRINKMTGKGDVGASLPRTPVRGSQNPNSELDYARVSEVPIIDHMDALRPEGSSWLIKETNVETLFGVKFTSQSDIEKKFEVDVSNSSPLVSSSTIINVPHKLNSIDVAATFGVPLSTIGDLQKLINDIEAGKHDELLSGMTNDDHMKTLDALGSICNSIQTNRNNAYVIPCKVSHEDDSINLNVDESTIPSDPIVKSMGINTKSTSYAGDASASAKEQRKVNSNFRTLVADLIFDGVNVFILCKVVRKVMTPPIVTTSNVITHTVGKTNDGFQTVSKKKKRKGKSKSTNAGQFTGPSVKQNVRYEPNATTTAPKKGATYRTNARQYNAPTVSKVAALITDDFGDGIPTRDIIVDKQDTGPKRISELHPSYMALQYPGKVSFHGSRLLHMEITTDIAVPFVYVIEFQKRGLPHAHILLWLEENCKCKTPAQIDDIISAELPSLTDDPDGYNVVTDYMLHGPCGKDGRYAPCTIK